MDVVPRIAIQVVEKGVDKGRSDKHSFVKIARPAHGYGDPGRFMVITGASMVWGRRSALTGCGGVDPTQDTAVAKAFLAVFGTSVAVWLRPVTATTTTPTVVARLGWEYH